MKPIIAGLLFAAVLVALAMSQTVAVKSQPTPKPINYFVDGDRLLMVKGQVADELRGWLVIEAHNGHEWAKRGFDPSYTRLVSDYKPMARKLPNGQWEIAFTSEIAENIP
jgi:hypothetical protein